MLCIYIIIIGIQTTMFITSSSLLNVTDPPPSFSYKLYNCRLCSFHTNNKKDFEKHCQTNKHVRRSQQPQQPQQLQQLQQLQQPQQPQPSCLFRYTKADTNATDAINNATDADDNVDYSKPPTFTYLNQYPQSHIPQPRDAYLCLCGKRYKNVHGLRYHKKKCNIITPELVMNVVNDNQELRNIIMAQNKLIMEHTQAFQQQITDLIPKLNSVNMNHQVVASTTNNTTIHHTHNTQNTFNLNIFLNEKCKDAWNMSDFIDSLKVTIDDLMVTRERGIGESIGRILVQGLSTLDVYKRPIHCTDLKRDTMYVKDKEVWERDEQNMKIKHAIDQLTYKQIISVDDWRHTKPNLMYDDKLQTEYNTVLLKVLTDPGEKDARKIIKSISKETALDKEKVL